MVRQMRGWLAENGRKGWVTGLFVALSLVLITLYVIAQWDQLVAYEWQIRPIFFLYALGAIFLTFALTAYTWHVIVSPFAPQTTLRINVKHWAYANLARRIPGSLWYIASRALLYGEQQVSKATISMLSGFEVVIILISGFIIAVLTLPFLVLPDSIITGQRSLGLLLIVALPLSLVLAHPAGFNRVWRLIHKVPPERALAWRDTLTGIGLYTLIWLVGSVAFFCLVNLVEPVPLARFPSLLSVWVIANSLSFAGSLTFGAFGVREISLTILLSTLVAPQVALMTAILVRICWLSAELVGGLLSLRL